MKYNRERARDFARKYWTRPCGDDFVGVITPPGVRKVDAGTEFKRDPDPKQGESAWYNGKLTIKRELLEDCAHFVSSCIGQPPYEKDLYGGLDLGKQPFPEAYGLFSVQGLLDRLSKQISLINVNGNAILSHDDAEKKLSELALSDLIFYWGNPDLSKPKDYRYYHVGLYLADSQKRIACHTYCRCDRTEEKGYPAAWDSVGLGAGIDTKYTLARVLSEPAA